MDLKYVREKQVAVTAVRRACQLTSSVFNNLKPVSNETIIKDDKSPVTVGDYGAQAVINTILTNAFPDDPIVGEEDTEKLRQLDDLLKNRIVELANEVLVAPPKEDESAECGLGGKARTADELLEAIDRGNGQGGREGRTWTVDPIDGTKGFLNAGQYAVCLALMINGEVVLGVIGCPNLPVKGSEPEGPRGCIFVAVKNQGAEQIDLGDGTSTSLTIPPVGSGMLKFLESAQAAHSNGTFNKRVRESLEAGEPIQMDSQAKYCCLARGDGGVYLRMPTAEGYKEKIWDHAPGSLLVQEAGGVITDSRRELLDFGLGRTLGENYGVIAARSEVHKHVLDAIEKVQAEMREKANA